MSVRENTSITTKRKYEKASKRGWKGWNRLENSVDMMVSGSESHEKDFFIKVDHLKKTYGKNIQALNGLSFSVKKGEIFGLLGPNGAGKSTAVNIITTLSRADEGDVWLAGVDIRRNPKKARKLLGYVAQRSGVDESSTGRNNLMLQGRLYGLKGSKLHDRVVELLDFFQLTKVADRLSHTYSEGMKRKLDIAMGLIHSPETLFLDEPTTGLDPEARADLWTLIKRLTNEQGLTVLLTTHYLEEADELCNRLIIMDRGKVIVEGTPEMLKEALRGDIIQIETVNPLNESLAKEILQNVPDLYEIKMVDESLYVRTNHGAETIPVLMDKMQARGFRVRKAMVTTPSLEDVFLQYTGRKFVETEEEL